MTDATQTRSPRRGLRHRLALLYTASVRRHAGQPEAATGTPTPIVADASDLEWVWTTITDLDAARELERRLRHAAR